MLPSLFSLSPTGDGTSAVIASTSGPLALFHQNRFGMWVRTGPIECAHDAAMVNNPITVEMFCPACNALFFDEGETRVHVWSDLDD